MLLERKEFLILLIIAVNSCALQTNEPCQIRSINDGYVCVCNENYCDTLDVPDTIDANQWLLVTSSKSAERFNYIIGTFQVMNKTMGVNKTSAEQIDHINIHINRSKVHQTILGFGASFTGSVTYLLNKMSTNLRNLIFTSYYTNSIGSGFTLLRMPIGGCDFDLEPWQYNEYPANEKQLTNFTALHPYDVQRIKYVKQLMNATQNSDIKIALAAWSAPRWMKTEHRWEGLNGNQLRKEYYQTWADFHVQFLHLLDEAGISVWTVSSGNEPRFSNFLPFISMNWNPANLATWIVKYLAPTLQQSKFANVQIITGDDNRDTLLDYLHGMNVAESNVMDVVSTIGVHGYFDFDSSPIILDQMAELYVNKTILYTEMCFGTTGVVSNTGAALGSWAHAEELINMLIDNLAHRMSGYIDWNMVLDHTGGPNYLGNKLDAAIIVNANFTEIYKQPAFYAMAHFSKFLPPGSQRITIDLLQGERNDKLKSVAFQRMDGKIVVILYNASPSDVIDVQVHDDEKNRIVQIQVKPKTVGTLLFTG